jgi:alanyl aminopeptidase
VLRHSAHLVMLARHEFMTVEQEARLAGFVRGLYGPRAAALGFVPKPNETAEERLLRESLVPLVANRGEDAKLIAEARKLTGQYLESPAKVNADSVRMALDITGNHLDFGTLDAALAAKKKTRDVQQARALSRMITRSRDPAVAIKVASMVLEPDVDPREAIYWLSGEPRTEQARFDFITKQFDQVYARTPAEAQRYLIFATSIFCDADHRTEVESFWRPRLDKLVGGERVLKQVLESIDLCIAARKVQQPQLTAFLEGLGPSAAKVR